MLSQIGAVTVPPEVMDKYYRRDPLTPEETQILAAQSRVGYDLLARIPAAGGSRADGGEAGSQASIAAPPSPTPRRLARACSKWRGISMSK
jgi:hypothetical protein